MGRMKMKKSRGSSSNFDWMGWCTLLLIVIITILGYPSNLFLFTNDAEMISLFEVWYYGWITAVSTGLGIIPFFFVNKPNKYWMGISNAIAGGMMIAASYGLLYEGFDANDVPGFYGYHAGFRTISGGLLGFVFVVLMKQILDQFEDIKIGSIDGEGAHRVLLIMFVMTLHSVSEGVGIGVSFGGVHGNQLGKFISLSLAMHNIPEGLAVALVLTSRGISKLRTALWSIFTSLPQPFMAIPAYIFVEHFKPLLPAGLGFAAGAMIFVAFFELFLEAKQEIGRLKTVIVGVISFALMISAQEYVRKTMY